jgi:membrane-associated phospholipid phosphatase
VKTLHSRKLVDSGVQNNSYSSHKGWQRLQFKRVLTPPPPTVLSTLQVPLPLHCGPPGVATGQGTPSVVSPSAAAAAALLLLLMLRVSMRLLLPDGFATRHDARRL